LGIFRRRLTLSKEQAKECNTFKTKANKTSNKLSWKQLIFQDKHLVLASPAHESFLRRTTPVFPKKEMQQQGLLKKGISVFLPCDFFV
jgi:hypothetical protein